jgi:hypothetical protein
MTSTDRVVDPNRPGRLTCPHADCRTAIRPPIREASIGSDGATHVPVNCHAMECPACDRFILLLAFHYSQGVETVLAFPTDPIPRPVPPEVPDPYRSDFNQAAAVIDISPQASAALSRRCLQQLLRDKAKATSWNLGDQIDEVVEAGRLPAGFAEDLDMVKSIGEFAAHPQKSEHTGEIMPVEPGEAAWSLDTLERLFELYFVLPARRDAARKAHGERIEEVGRRPLKDRGSS